MSKLTDEAARTLVPEDYRGLARPPLTTPWAVKALCYEVAALRESLHTLLGPKEEPPKRKPRMVKIPPYKHPPIPEADRNAVKEEMDEYRQASFTGILGRLISEGCYPGLYRRGDQWRFHVNCSGNFWHDDPSPVRAALGAVELWLVKGKPMDGMAHNPERYDDGQED